MHYKDEGTGPAVLLIHGTASSLHTWDDWVAELRDRFRLVRLDLPGFGLTGPTADDVYSAERRTDVMVALLDHLNIRVAAVAGNSLGGYLAWQLAWRHPERVDRLILLDASGYPRDEPGGTVLSLAGVPLLGQVLGRFTPRSLVAAGVEESYYDPAKVTPELIDRYYDLLLRDGNRQALLAAFRAGWRDEHHAIRTLQQPTLVMWGAEDRLVPVADAERFHQDLPSSELLIYPEVGHLPMEEIPARSARDAAAFLLREL
ncbi:MAG: alpha/beta hydrolase [Acidobacteriota bacterium]